MTSKEKSVDADALAPVSSDQVVDIERYVSKTTHDAVFGEIVEGEGPNYRNLGWLGTAVLMMKTQIGLGVLSIPMVFDSLGMIPGIVCLLAIAVITTWSNYVIGVFKANHPEVYGIDDAGRLIFGKFGHLVFGVAFVLYMIFIVGSGILSLSIALNALSTHAVCTAVFVAVATVVAFLLASVRTLDKISWMCWVGLVAILVSIFTLTVSVGVQDRPAAAPQQGIWISDYKLTAAPRFSRAASALSSLVFAYAGTPAFFNIVSEMRDVRAYNKALALCQTTVTVTYLVIGILVYYFCGSYVASPALGSAGPVMKKVCYGLALPGLLASTVITLHLPAKYVLIRLLRGTRHLISNGPIHWSTWFACTAAVAIIAYVIASAIPVFGSLVSLVGALLGTLMSFIPFPFMWLHDNWNKSKANPTWAWRLMVVWCMFVFVLGVFLLTTGTYGSIVDIIETYAQSGGSAAWSCADNSL